MKKTLLPPLILFSAVTMVCSILLYLRYEALKNGFMHGDIATYLNYLWNTNFWDQILYSDQLYFNYGYPTFLVEHFAPTLLLMAPLYQWFPSPVFLIVVTSTVPVVSTFFIYRISQEILRAPWLSVLISIAYLLHPVTLVASYDLGGGFHHDCLIPPLVFATVYFFLTYRQKKISSHSHNLLQFLCTSVYVSSRLFLCFFLLLGIKENLPVIAAVACTLLVIKDKHTRIESLAGVGLCLLFFGVGNFLLPGALDVVPQHSHKIIKAFFERGIPVLDIFAFLMENKVLFLFFPVFFVPVFLLPLTSEFLMYTYSETGSLLNYYGFAPMSIITVAYIFGVVRFRKFCLVMLRPSLAMMTVLFTLIAICGVSGAWGYQRMHAQIESLRPSPNNILDLDLTPALATIPQEAHLTTSALLHTLLSNRKHLIRHRLDHADYVLVNMAWFHFVEYDAPFLQTLEYMLSQNLFSHHFSDRYTIVFKRVADPILLSKLKDTLVPSKVLPPREAIGYMSLIYSYALEAGGKTSESLNELSQLQKQYQSGPPHLLQKVNHRINTLIEASRNTNN